VTLKDSARLRKQTINKMFHLFIHLFGHSLYGCVSAFPLD